MSEFYTARKSLVVATQRDGEVLQSEITKNSTHIVWGDYFKIFMHVDKQNEKIVFTVAELLVFFSLSLFFKYKK